MQEQQVSFVLCKAAYESQIALVAVADHLLLLTAKQGTSRGLMVPLGGPFAPAVAKHLYGWVR